MAKIIRYLLILILLTLRSNAYAWYCNFSQTEDGWYQDGSMVCVDIDVQVALEEHYCTWYKPNDPYCAQYQEPICVDTIEYQTLSCHTNYSRGIQQSRTYVCQQASWTDWTTTSDNCTANPPTCNSSFDSRTMACASGYEGQIDQQRISSCPDPYGDPIWSDWTDISNSCKQSITNVENPTSPISPLNTESPTNPISILDVPISVEQEVIPMPQVSEQAADLMGINPSTVEANPQSSTEKINNTVESVKDSNQSNNTSTNKHNQQNKDGQKDSSNDRKENSIDLSKEIVHGFGLVLSMDILQKPLDFYQPNLEDPFNIIQEFPVEQRLIEELYLDVFRQNDIANYYYINSNSTWERIRSSDILQ